MTSYDLVPYGGWSYAFTFPDLLATVAKLRGIDSPPVENCRVLEIGCAAGDNLIPMAEILPGSHFVGIDFAARQIEQGREALAHLGLTNVALFHMDLADWGGTLGQFDYVIAHGIYSWVAKPIRSALLSLVGDVLTRTGVAYISYNTYPGWHMLESMRRMMLYHIRDIQGPEEQAAAARELIGFLVKATDSTPYGLVSFPAAYQQLVNGYFHGVLNMEGRADSHFLHDELEAVNEPCYFHEFVDHAAAHGLDYVADAEFSSGLTAALPGEVVAKMTEIAPSQRDRGQYSDFVVNRTFRRSILCRGGISMTPAVDMSVMDHLYFASQAQGQLAPGADPEAASIEFAVGDGPTLTSDHAVTIVGITHLRSIWPQRATLDEILDLAYAQMIETNPHLHEELFAALADRENERRATDRFLLATNLLQAYSINGELVSFHLTSAPFTTQVGIKPIASSWARWESTKRSVVTDLRLRRVALSPQSRYLLPLLDGTRDRDALIKVIQEDFSEATALWREDSSMPLSVQIDDTLEQIARSALLLAST